MREEFENNNIENNNLENNNIENSNIENSNLENSNINQEDEIVEEIPFTPDTSSKQGFNNDFTTNRNNFENVAEENNNQENSQVYENNNYSNQNYENIDNSYSNENQGYENIDNSYSNNENQSYENINDNYSSNSNQHYENINNNYTSPENQGFNNNYQNQYSQNNNYQQQANDFNSNHVNEERVFNEHIKRNIKKKKSGIAKRIFVIMTSAALFGVVAGASMIGVTKLAYNTGVLPKGGNTVIGRAVDETSKQVKLNTVAANSTTQSISSSSSDVSAIVEKAMPSVVAINAETTVSQRGWFGESQTYKTPTSGSGIIIGENDEELLIVTNNHVVQDTNKLSVVFIDQKEVKATVKGGDSDNDLAVIAVKLSDLTQETRDKIALASIGNSDALKVGQGVVAIGNALGYGQSVTVGYVSALNREVKTDDGDSRKFIQTDAAINPGNSGGALLNMNGEVIGINSVKYSSTQVEGMGYAIPITAVQDIITELSNKPTRTVVSDEEQGTLGIQAQNIDESISKAYDIPKGVYIYKIVPDSAASKSELREKDIITKINEEKIENYEQLKEALSYYKAGDTITVTINRLRDSEYQEEKIEIKLGSKSDLTR